jgi:DnaJ-class molecular chaperone
MPQCMPQGMPQSIHIFHSRSKPPPILKTLTINIKQVFNGGNIPLEIERWSIENGIKVYENETIYVLVPKGIYDNEMINFSEKGHIINKQIKGDVQVKIKIINDSIFKRSGLDLILDKKISLKEALCGFSFEIKYINGKSYTLKNKGNIISPEYKNVISNMGLTRDNHCGNMIIHFHIEFPENLTNEQIEKIAQIL